MKLSRAVLYALHALVGMSAREPGHCWVAQTIAESRHIPTPYLGRVLKLLVRARILDSLRGPSGGYTLARPIKNITLLDVVEAVDGPLRGQIPFTQGNGKKLEAKLEVIFDQMADQARRQLEKVRVSDLAGRS